MSQNTHSLCYIFGLKYSPVLFFTLFPSLCLTLGHKNDKTKMKVSTQIFNRDILQRGNAPVLSVFFRLAFLWFDMLKHSYFARAPTIYMKLEDCEVVEVRNFLGMGSRSRSGVAEYEVAPLRNSLGRQSGVSSRRGKKKEGATGGAR